MLPSRVEKNPARHVTDILFAATRGRVRGRHTILLHPVCVPSPGALLYVLVMRSRTFLTDQALFTSPSTTRAADESRKSTR